ncbi:MAG: tyrosine-type recombinase/integrase [Candidatus Acidiferrales bacterium]
MSLYKRGDVWWYKFRFAGQLIRESSKSESKTVAKEAERSRRRELEGSFNRISKPRTAQLVSTAAEMWLRAKTAHLSPRSVIIERANLKHINPYFGKMLLCDIAADDIARYQASRLEQGAAPKTVNLEVGTLRAILRKNRLWASIQPDVRMLRVREDVGRAISRDEEAALLEACRASRSRSLYPAVLIALNTCMRYSELRLLRWGQVDLNSGTLTVGHSKTESGTGRLLPLNDRAVAILGFWASLFPLREPSHFVFRAERYGASGDGLTLVYDSDPTRPIGRWKEAWESAKIRADVSCRFHDLRHTGCTRMLEAGVPFSVVATIMGWSPSTTVRMARRYGHIGQTAQRQAVNALGQAGFQGDGAQNWAHFQTPRMRQLAN